MAAKRNKDAASRPNPIPVRFGKADMDDYEELWRRFQASDIENISTFIKQLLSTVLNPDPSSEKEVRQLLRDLMEATSSLRARVENVDSTTKKMRVTVAKGVAVLLVEAADWPLEKAEKWVREKLQQ